MTCSGCAAPITRHSHSGKCVKCTQKRAMPAAIPPPLPPTPTAALAFDRQTKASRSEGVALKAKYEEALKTIERLEAEVTAVSALGDTVPSITIEPLHGSKTSEATCVWTASDWHIEEAVGPEVGTLNRYTLAIAEQRARTFFQGGLRLTDLLAQDVKIKTIILALLGDFISNDIHEEFPEINQLQPVHALATVQSWIIAGIEMILAHSAYELVIPCHSGNHARTTRTTRFSSEAGHSLEHLMYAHIAAHFRHEPRVKVLLPEGMHSYVTVYDMVIRFQHGHSIKYGGGVGGIYIPVNKAIAQWNKARRADLDVFGHFHQLRDGGNFLCNGSMIGYNAFALAIKADYERPKQALFLLDKKRGRTCTWPILFDK